MFKTILKYLQLGLDLLKAEPSDREAIQALQAQVTTLNAELAAARASLPTEEDKTAIDEVLAQFAALTAHPPKPPVTLEGVVPVAVEPEADPEDTPPTEPYPESDGAVVSEVAAAPRGFEDIPAEETPVSEVPEGSDGQ